MSHEYDPSQDAALAQHRDKWIDIQLNTSPVNVNETAAAIRDLYKAAGLEEPKSVIVVPEFLVLNVASAIALHLGEGSKILPYSGPKCATRESIYYAVQAIQKGVAEAYINVGHQEQVELEQGWLREFVSAHYPEIKLTDFLKKVVHSPNWCAGGAYSSYYDAYLTARRDVQGLQLPEHQKYAFWERCAKLAPWRCEQPGFCIVADFPEFILRDEDNRPHCQQGPSHRFRSGLEYYYWHGTVVPKEWILNPESIDPNLALTHENVELRRCAAEIVGWDKVIDLVEHKVVQQDKWGVLYDVKFPEVDEVQRFVRVEEKAPDGEICLASGGETPRIFCFRVPSECKEAGDAVAWSYDITREELEATETRT